MVVSALPATPPAHVSQDLATLLARPRTKRVQANGLWFTYQEWGDPTAPLVLCLHGFPDSPHTWDTLGPVLARAGYRVAAPWTRGYYPTEKPADGDDSANALGRDVLALIAALGSDRAVVIGHDWGALAAYAANSLSPEHISKLVLVAIPHPLAITPDAAFGRANHFLSLPLPGAARAFAADDVAGVDRILHKWSPHWKPSAAQLDDIKRPFRVAGGTESILGYYRAFAAATAGVVPAFKFKPVKTPTLLVYGTEDGAVEPRFFDATRPFFTGSFKATPLAGVGHFPQAEQPAEFNAAVAEFLKP